MVDQATSSVRARLAEQALDCSGESQFRWNGHDDPCIRRRQGGNPVQRDPDFRIVQVLQHLHAEDMREVTPGQRFQTIGIVDQAWTVGTGMKLRRHRTERLETG